MFRIDIDDDSCLIMLFEKYCCIIFLFVIVMKQSVFKQTSMSILKLIDDLILIIA